jgi:ribokinase
MSAMQPLRDLGIDLQHVRHIPNTATAVAMIVGYPSAESTIVLANNANDAWTDDDHETVAAVIAAAPAESVLVTDFEIPVRVVQHALEVAVHQGHRVIADPSPADRVPLAMLPYVDYLTPNAGEATRLTGIKVDSLDTAFAAAQSLHKRGAGMVLVKLSDGGCVVWGAAIQEHVPSTGVQPVDTTGAGDAFAGALGVAILEKQPVSKAVRFAVAAADHAVTQYGSQAAYPTRIELERRLI